MSPSRPGGLHDALASLNETVRRIENEQSGMRAEIRELRQEVGLSLPPAGMRKERAVQRAWFHLGLGLRYGLLWGAGAASAWLVDLLARWLGG
jgi:hypothetical protein